MAWNILMVLVAWLISSLCRSWAQPPCPDWAAERATHEISALQQQMAKWDEAYFCGGLHLFLMRYMIKWHND